MKHKLEQVPFTNHIGQVLQVGDEVLAIASGYSHSLHISKGVYVGTVNGNPSVIIEEMASGYWQDGKMLDYYDAQAAGVPYTRQLCNRRTTLPAGRVYRIS